MGQERQWGKVRGLYQALFLPQQGQLALQTLGSRKSIAVEEQRGWESVAQNIRAVQA